MSDKFLREKYGLKERVIEDFSRDKASEEDLKFWTNREKELKDWKAILRKSVKIHKNFIIFIIGSYGRGKTLSLLKIKDEAEKNFKEIIFPVYSSFKGEEKSKPGLDFIFRIFKSIDFDKLVKNKEYNLIIDAINKIPENFDESKNLLKAIYGYKKQLPLHKPTTKDEKSKMALYFLRGEIKPTSSQLRELGIMRKIESIDIAKEHLAAILCFMKNLGYESLLLTIDEFEYLFSLVSKSQYSIYLALLRGLYDFPIGLDVTSDRLANMIFFIGISEDGWNKLHEIEKKEISEGGPTQPLMRRVDLKTILLNFDRKNTEELIKKVLRYNRITKKFEENPLIPFTKDFVDYIYELTEGLPSAVKVRCAQVLDAGLAEKIPLLTREYAKKILEERRF
ncbi:MAG: DUF2791 family P-loop domain-containing protein [Thermoplasmata archaeon]|nr:DUF2791 family P-loop domain-containing protein [Thermoplasmata archaeon]